MGVIAGWRTMPRGGGASASLGDDRRAQRSDCESRPSADRHAKGRQHGADPRGARGPGSPAESLLGGLVEQVMQMLGHVDVRERVHRLIAPFCVPVSPVRMRSIAHDGVGYHGRPTPVRHRHPSIQGAPVSRRDRGSRRPQRPPRTCRRRALRRWRPRPDRTGHGRGWQGRPACRPRACRSRDRGGSRRPIRT
jgi:hypothetical protein